MAHAMPERMPDGFVRAARLSDISTAHPLGVTLDGGERICLVRESADAATAVHAIVDRCTHKDFALSGGDLVAPCIIECPWHGARYDVRSGQVVGGPAIDPVATYPVRIIGGEVFVAPRERS